MSSLVVAPALETPRLRLRGHGLDDFPQSAAMWADPVVVRYIRPIPFTEEETWARLLRYVGHWALLGYGFWVVEDKQTGEFLGEAGFLNFHRDTDPPRVINIPEAGWAFRAAAHGRGYATRPSQPSSPGPTRISTLRPPASLSSECGVDPRGGEEWVSSEAGYYISRRRIDDVHAGENAVA